MCVCMFAESPVQWMASLWRECPASRSSRTLSLRWMAETSGVLRCVLHDARTMSSSLSSLVHVPSLPSGFLSAEVFRRFPICHPHIISSVSERDCHRQLRCPLPAPLCAHGQWIQLSRAPSLHRLGHGKSFPALNYTGVLMNQLWKPFCNARWKLHL